MLIVRTKVMQSNIEGLGLFAATNIAVGIMIWTFRAHFDRKFVNMPRHPVVKEFVVKYGYKPLSDSDTYYLSVDNMRFINHSTNPNVIPRGTDLVAGRNIMAWEELTMNYTLNYMTDDPGSQEFYEANDFGN